MLSEKKTVCPFCTPRANTQTALTEKQHKILIMIANGLRTQEIAFELGVKPETVSKHLEAVRKKLNAKTNAHATYIACRNKEI
jgi:DNA-binding NarL/FixJ family response regulator